MKNFTKRFYQKRMKKNKLKIAQIAPCWYPIPPEKYGGIERIVFLLSKELKKLGHQVTLFAPGGSKVSTKLVKVFPKSLTKMGFPWTENVLNLESLLLAIKKEGRFDILHSHLDYLTLFFQDLTKTPILQTFHNPMEEKRLSSKSFLYKLHQKNVLGTFISKNQKKNCPFKFKKSWVVYNGIDIPKFNFNSKPEDYFLWVGRLDPYKGVENAIKVARILGIKLFLAGKIDPRRKDYFKSKIRPYLSKKIQYLGELPQKELNEVYQNAKACFYPIEWEEPFGLIMVESMACGAPVIAFKKGSVPEIVEDGKTGYVVPFFDERREKNIKGLIEAVKKIEMIKRENCRKRVEKFFTGQIMAKNYEKIYFEILKK